MIRKIVVAVDGSVEAERALAYAAELASKLQASVVLIHVLLRSSTNDQMRAIAERLGFLAAVKAELDRTLVPTLATARAGAGVAVFGVVEDTLRNFAERILAKGTTLLGEKAIVATTEIADDDPATAILRCVEKEGADMLVVGSAGMGRLSGLVLGSVSQKVAQAATCACLIVK